MEYLSERSNPRAKKLVFYCEKCRAFRFTFEFPNKDILTVLLDSINPADILPSEFSKQGSGESEISISPLAQKGNISQLSP